MALFVIGIVLIIMGDEFVFGSVTDWISQHSVFPDYFRQYFYETGNLIPKFNMNLGAGQNGYNIAYHGLLNPIILISYLFPNVRMFDYIMISSVVIVIFSSYLFYRWEQNNKIRQDIAFVGMMLFTCASPLLFHSHRQIMFVQYMPFVIMALMGVDRFYKKKKAELLIISVVLIILTNYYFSIGAIISVTIYAIYKFFNQLEIKSIEFRWKDFFSTAFKYAGCIITAIMMCGILLLPTFMALLIGREKNPESEGISWLLTFVPNPSLSVVLYSAYGLGLTAIVIFAIVGAVMSKKKSRMFLGVSFILLTIIPFIRYLLNAGLYSRGKVLIPLIPIFIFAVTLFLKDLIHDKVNTKLLKIVMPVIFVILAIANIDNNIVIPFVVDMVIMFPIILFIPKMKKKKLAFIPIVGIAIITCIIANFQDGLVKVDYIEVLNDSNKISAIKNTLENDKNFYRMNELDDVRYTCNMQYGEGYYQTSLYSSVYSNSFNRLVHDTLNLTNPTINRISSINENNIMFQTLMGVKYVSSYTGKVPAGYVANCSSGKNVVYRNDKTYSLGFATSKTMSEADFLQLDDKNRQMALLQYIVVPNEDTDYFTVQNQDDYNVNEGASQFCENIADYITPFTKIDVDIDFGGEYDENGNCKIRLEDKKIIKVDLDNCEYDVFAINISIEKVGRDRVDISINDVRNALSGRKAAFINNNLNFGYIISSNKGIDELEIKLHTGEYTITGYSIYGTYYNEIVEKYDTMDMMENIEITDNTISGEIEVSKDGYFNATIPYDEGFTLYVDDVETKIEMTDTSFMGCAISEGKHTIKFVYEVPGYKYGKIITIIGTIIFIGIICYDLVCLLGRRQKKHS